MAINPGILLQGRTADAVGALQRGQQLGDMMRNASVRDAILQQQKQAGEMKLQQNQMALTQQKAAIGARMLQQLGSVPLEERAGLLAKMAPQMMQAGFTEQEIMSQGLTDREIADELRTAQTIAAPTQGEAFTLKPGETRFGAGGQVIAQGGELPDENQGKIRSEVRSELRKTTGDLRKTAGNLRSNYEKLQGLAEQMRSGNRTAVSQGLVALVKLGDPTSVVREAEMEAALNKQNPLAAVTNLLQSKGTASDVVSAVASKIDPLSPENVNVDDVLSTANAMMVPNIQEVKRNFAIVQQRAQENLTEDGIKSVYGKATEDLFGELGQIEANIMETSQRQAAPDSDQQTPAQVVLTHPDFGEVTEADIQRTMQDNNMTREQVLQRLQGGQ